MKAQHDVGDSPRPLPYLRVRGRGVLCAPLCVSAGAGRSWGTSRHAEDRACMERAA